jgi:hypothetical protein
MNIISPDGVLIDGAEIRLYHPPYWYQPGHLTIFTREPVRNEGGKIDVSGDFLICDGAPKTKERKPKEIKATPSTVKSSKTNETWRDEQERLLEESTARIQGEIDRILEEFRHNINEFCRLTRPTSGTDLSHLTINDAPNAIFQNCLKTKESKEVLRGRLFDQPFGSFTLTHPYSQPGILSVGGNMIVSAFENFASQAYVKGQMKHPKSSKKPKITQEDFVAAASLSGYPIGFWSYCEGGQFPVYKFLKPLEKRIQSNFSTTNPLKLEYPDSEIYKLEGVVQSPVAQVLIKGGALVQIGGDYKGPRPNRTFEPIKMFAEVGIRSSAMFKRTYGSKTPWLHKPIMSLPFKIHQSTLMEWLAHQTKKPVHQPKPILKIKDRDCAKQQNKEGILFLETEKQKQTCLKFLMIKSNDVTYTAFDSSKNRDLQNNSLISLLKKAGYDTNGDTIETVLKDKRVQFKASGKKVFAGSKEYPLAEIMGVYSSKGHLLTRRTEKSTGKDPINILEKHEPYPIHKPEKPLSPDISLAPAVVITEKGLALAEDFDTDMKFLLHPLQEIDTLMQVLINQIGRPYLDINNPDNFQAFVRGRQLGYEFYQEDFAPKALEIPPVKGTNTALALQKYSKDLTQVINSLPQREKDKYKFMILYYPSKYEDGALKLDVLMPASCISPLYDNPALRNPDGGLFANKVEILGKSPDAEVHIRSTVHGEDVNRVKVANVTIERPNHERTVRVVDTFHKKGGWFSDDTYSYTVRDITLKTPIKEAGILSTGERGELDIKAKNFDLLNGAEVHGGSDNLIDIGKLKTTSAIEQKVVRSEGGARGRHYVTHGTASTIHPPRWVFPNGATLEIENANLSGDEFIAQKGDLVFKITKGHLGAAKAQSFLGMTVHKEGKAVVVEHRTADVASQCKFLALDGDVYWKIKDKITGEAPIFYGKIITVDGNVDINSLLLKMTINRESVAESLFSSTKTTSMQESPIEHRAIFEGQQIIFKNGEAHLGGAHIRAAVKVVDGTTSGLKIDPTVAKMYYRHNTDVSSPLSKARMGGEGWQEVQIQPIIETPILERTSKRGRISLTNALLNVGEIKGKYEILTRKMESQKREWSEQSQVIPQAVVIAAAIAGAWSAGGFLAPLLQLGTGGSMMIAAVQSIVSMATTSLLQTGDPEKTIKDLSCRKSLQTVLESALTAGVVDKAGFVLNVDMKPGQKGLVNNFSKSAVQNGARAAVQTVLGKKPEQAFVDGLKQTAVDGVSATGANYIADHVQDPVLNKIAHGGAAAGINVATGGNQKAALSSAAAAMIAETVAEAFINLEQIKRQVDTEGHPDSEKPAAYQKKRDEQMMWVRAATVALVTACGGDTEAANYAADTVLQNNFATTKGRIPTPTETNPVTEEEEEKKEKIRRNQGDRKNKATRRTQKSGQNDKAENAPETGKIDPADIYLNMVDQQQKLPQEDYFFDAVRNSENSKNKSTKVYYGNLVDDDYPEPVMYPSDPYWGMGTGIVNNFPQNSLYRDISAEEAIRCNFLPRDNRALWEPVWEWAKDVDYLNVASYLPIPYLGGAAVYACEGRDIYYDRKTLGESAFDLGLAYVGGKALVWTGHGFASGARYLGHKIVDGLESVWPGMQQWIPKRVNVTRPFRQVVKHDISRNTWFWKGVGFEDYNYCISKDCNDFPEHGRTLQAYYDSFKTSRDIQKALVVIAHGGSNTVSWKTQKFVIPKQEMSTPQRKFKYGWMFPKSPVYPVGPFRGSAIIDVTYDLTHRPLAKLIQKQPGYVKGQSVLLCSCSTGKYSDGIAQKLANKLGAPVQAASGLVCNPTSRVPSSVVNTPFVSIAKLINKYNYKYKLKLLQGEIRTFYPGEWHPRLVPVPDTFFPSVVLLIGSAIGGQVAGYIFQTLDSSIFKTWNERIPEEAESLDSLVNMTWDEAVNRQKIYDREEIIDEEECIIVAD